MPLYSVPDGRKWLYGKDRDALLSLNTGRHAGKEPWIL